MSRSQARSLWAVCSSRGPIGADAASLAKAEAGWAFRGRTTGAGGGRWALAWTVGPAGHRRAPARVAERTARPLRLEQGCEGSARLDLIEGLGRHNPGYLRQKVGR